jgi:hypothetical protein
LTIILLGLTFGRQLEFISALLMVTVVYAILYLLIAKIKFGQNRKMVFGPAIFLAWIVFIGRYGW